MARIFLSPPDVGELEAKYVQEALASGWAAPTGPDLDAFEAEFAARVGVSHAVAVCSGTAGLHLALLALGVRSGDAVLTSTMTFAATANAITYVGAEPVFVDCERATGNIDISLLTDAVGQLVGEGRRIGALVPVDLLGKCADMHRLTSLAEEVGAPLLVDAAESVGASYLGQPAGSFGDASIVSFNGNKIMTTSGGGMVLTDDRVIADRVRYLATQARQPVAHYEHTDIGYNYRLSNLLAALGRAQLVRLDQMLTRRRMIRRKYREMFTGISGVDVFQGDGAGDNCWLTAITVSEDAPWSADELSAELALADIETRPLWKPMHLQPIFARARAFITGEAEWIFRHGLALPSGSRMSGHDFDRVIHAVDSFLSNR